jgi:glycosyltransferase involved in cell wall biosynthesis
MYKTSIALYLQHYLAPSMTFIYRQLKSAENKFNPIVICSDRLENQDQFQFDKIFLKRRNFIRIKKSRVIRKLVGEHRLLSTNPRVSKQQLNYFSEVLLKNEVKLIHAHFGPSGIEICDLAKKIKIPLIVTFHGYDASILLTMKNYVKNIQSVFKYAHIIAISNSMKNDLIRYGADAKNISVVRCGIPLDHFKFVEREPLYSKFSENKRITFLQVSNFIEKKGHMYTVKAFYNFSKNYSNAKLILAGDGYLKNSIINLCKELKILDKVTFPGLVNEKLVFELMKNADVFLHHSVTSEKGDKEGIPTVIMEAMATGLPVISTFHSAIPELIYHNQDGFLVEEKDIDGYTDVMLKLHDKNLEIGLKAREKVINDFNLNVEMEKLIELYNSLIDTNN